ncbi:methylated-DNA--protein-cysteine methyltransferase isoform X2 [Alligator mississippiensis]|nr:methylated-DNA--protein-cysteine methyltransferase isoform X2 [Alligator mississippiensis]XP_019338435.1 methylated-DNA--protein-cysteine methyltransferase isoform X2 [Alligator mississippiensis]XP_019338436.1 methylated-DNA--protein-cysteine methyltransferase isoform X2 [Alligator mississippiensis]XP_019338437.1 methylated-DNA--protein-cysteine methyltransferase isoform X2 [Alligator mississippiensis]XP_019338438.1 methylated-DNA--protein-cysteine methyltransferase isoform X2 [Alligator mis
MALKDGKAQCKMMLVVLDSPMGRIEISGCETGIHELSLQKDAVPPNGTKEASVTCELCEGPEEMTEPLKQCTAWLSAYFCEPRITEKLPIPSFHHPVFEQASFTRQVLWTLLRDVKFGETVSYKQLADLAGNSKAARAVGGAMRSNPWHLPCQQTPSHCCWPRLKPCSVPQTEAEMETAGARARMRVELPIIIPCHRVICSSGQTGNYTGGNHLKEWLLSHEKLQKEKLAY